jgi:hypothetical protein
MLILLVTFGIHDVDSVVLSTKPAFSTLSTTPVSSSSTSDPSNVTGEMIIRTFHVLFTFKPGMFIYKDVFPSVSIRALRYSS